MIQLLTFDLDNTLWETEPVVAAAEKILLDWLERQAPLFTRNLDSDARRALRKQVLAIDPELRHRVTDLRIAVLRHGLRQAGYPEAEASALALQGFDVFLEARHAVELFPHAEPLLAELSRHFALATISNGNADVRRLGLDKYFQAIVSADEVGISKPAPEPFLAALQRVGVEPANALHIGDHPSDDVLGARSVGMGSLWFNRHRTPWPEEHQRPDGEVHCLSEIGGWVTAFNTTDGTQR
ncbi:HAD family hydrolase [Halopseudomonas salegens]|uniref:Putative hydrolase of the HAD superfamily n=1 Tax=Halopseudomonas salegens TaxID=1434072 RepID=A0A1H2HXB8_9GAMM|nr:HAD family hydrolase [Halopseudomonas salegens]SDU36434.1 putative hydrolase of the HAD superfamily [Halopseudomonas salegens]